MFYDSMSTWVDEDVMADRIGTPSGQTVEKTYSLAAGETMTVFTQFNRFNPAITVSEGQKLARIWITSDDEISITMTTPSTTRAIRGVEEGYKATDYRRYLNEEVLAMMPETLRDGIKEVKKWSPHNRTEGEWSLEKVWAPSLEDYNYDSRNTDFAKCGIAYTTAFPNGLTLDTYIRNKGVPAQSFTRNVMDSGNAICTYGNGWAGDGKEYPQYVWFGFCT